MSHMTQKKSLPYEAYTVGWICALQCELNAARALLDEEYEGVPCIEKDTNSYLLGRSGVHNVVIATAGGGYGTVVAAEVASQMVRTFKKIRFGLLVGIGGGVPLDPDPEEPADDIRLGDIVVSRPRHSRAGVFHYDSGKISRGGAFEVRSHLNKPPTFLLKAIFQLESDHGFNQGQLSNYIDEVAKKAQQFKVLKRCRFPGRDKDLLFATNCHHELNKRDCTECDMTQLVMRLDRENNHPSVHYGEIASGSSVMTDPQMRDKLRDSHDVRCFETEAAGLMDHFPCLIIRGICDYCDDHKNDIWQPYAAVVAAAYAKDLLRIIKPLDVENARVVLEVLGGSMWQSAP
ncbi:purine and uridine phosphorylase [Aspergillus varians]